MALVACQHLSWTSASLLRGAAQEMPRSGWTGAWQSANPQEPHRRLGPKPGVWAAHVAQCALTAAARRLDAPETAARGTSCGHARAGAPAATRTSGHASRRLAQAERRTAAHAGRGEVARAVGDAATAGEATVDEPSASTTATAAAAAATTTTCVSAAVAVRAWAAHAGTAQEADSEHRAARRVDTPRHRATRSCACRRAGPASSWPAGSD